MKRILMLTLAQAILVVGIVGCAYTPANQDGFNYSERKNYLQHLDGWSLRGRIAVDTGQQAFQGGFQWQQSMDSIDLAIRGPLGTGLLQIAGSASQLIVHARGETWELNDPETELSELLGWWLPVESFSSWLLGYPDPEFSAETVVGPDNALRSLIQRNWNLRYESYQLAGGVILPQQINLAYQDLELRVIIDRWQRSSDE